jgi:hypothetical protein
MKSDQFDQESARRLVGCLWRHGNMGMTEKSGTVRH